MIVTRFAPSPTGRLHPGHAFAALFAWHAARDAGGRALLRLEDIDAARCRPEHATGIVEDLAWFGLDWDGPVRRQSEHIAAHAAALDRLAARGLVYPCFCTRAEIAQSAAAPHGPGGPLYPGTCRGLDPAVAAERCRRAPFAWRLDVVRAMAATGPLTWRDRTAGQVPARPETLGDVVLARKDVPTSYHLAVVVDDAAQGVTLVTRGEDLFHATHVHRLLQALLGLPVPDYAHHRLIRAPDGMRLAKRRGGLTLAGLRDAGWTPAQVAATYGFSDLMAAPGRAAPPRTPS